MHGKKLTNQILKGLDKARGTVRPERTEAEVFAGVYEPEVSCAHCLGIDSHRFDCAVFGALKVTEACCECHLSKSEFREGPVLRCLRCQKALCFLCTGVHLDCRNRCEEAK